MPSDDDTVAKGMAVTAGTTVGAVPEVVADAFADVVGQERAVRALRAAARSPVHAYLLVGPAGAGARVAAQAMSAALLCAEGGCGRCRDCRLALRGEHPDAIAFIPTGAALSRDQADEIVRVAVRSPTEGPRKVLLIHDLHRMQPNVAPTLLKTIEEPPPSTVFVAVAEHLPRELVTIASRCVRIDLAPLAAEVVESVLLAEGTAPAPAADAARAALGDLDRARLLVTDEGLGRRRAAWTGVPARLDGSGAAVAVVAAELVDLVDQAASPLKAAQADELAALEERVATFGERGGGRKQLADEHRRQVRRHRTGELRFGLATLAGRYRDALASGDTGGGGGVPTAWVSALGAIDTTGEALDRNPSEALLLQALLIRLPSLP